MWPFSSSDSSDSSDKDTCDHDWEDLGWDDSGGVMIGGPPHYKALNNEKNALILRKPREYRCKACVARKTEMEPFKQVLLFDIDEDRRG